LFSSNSLLVIAIMLSPPKSVVAGKSSFFKMAEIAMLIFLQGKI
jgi:hypothetical protein